MPARIRTRRSLAFALAALATWTAVGVLAQPAAGGSYVATLCSALSPSAGGASWEPTSAHYGQRSACDAGQGVQVFHDAESTDLDRYGAWVWRAPAGTVLTSIQANASLVNQAGHRGELWASAANGSGAVQWGSEHGDFQIHSIDGEFGQFSAMLRCAAPGAGGRCGRAGNDAAHAYLKGIFARVEDRAAPGLAITGGSLLGEQVVRGTRTLAFTGSDAGSGVRAISIRANGAELVHDARNCALAQGFATALSPCAPSTSELAGVDTASALALGPDNTVAACVEDLALDGMPNRTCEERRIWVDNACPSSGGGADRLTAFFADEHVRQANPEATRATTRSDRSPRIAGRLTAGGAPVSGAIVCALTRVRLGDQPVSLAATARTDAAGAYALELPPGASREVFVHQAWGDRVVARHGLELDSEARPTLEILPRRAARNRGRLRFTGVLPSPACPERVVKVQARVGKRRWQVFRTDRTDGDCRFSARYRLRSTRKRTTYRFRAHVPAQQGYPYLAGYSEIERKKVKPRTSSRTQQKSSGKGE